ncbi:MAG: hypothetical protein IJR14_01125 [Synergistaceae bacterium]|nr:hypothetical protein [Synergistaceae bacterium]
MGERERIEVGRGEAEALTVSLAEALGMEGAREGARPEAESASARGEGEGGTLRIAKAILQRTRVGGGKWAVRTLLRPQPDAARLDELAREARRALGTGARVEDGAVVIQGDIAERVEAWIRGRGAREVVR